MKLYEALEANRGRGVKIGAACNYIFAGRTSDKTVAEIEKINDAYESYYRQSIDKYKEKAENAESELRREIDNARKTLKRNANGEVIRENNLRKARRLVALTPEEFKVEARMMRNSYQKQRDRLINYVSTAKRFVDRDVIDSYPSITGDGTILIIEGIEVGKYWTPEEYSKDNNKLNVTDEQRGDE